MSHKSSQASKLHQGKQHIYERTQNNLAWVFLYRHILIKVIAWLNVKYSAGFDGG
jgi:hypothetical protein